MTDFTQLSESDLKRVTTRDGRKVRILCVDGEGRQPIAGWVEGCNGPSSWSSSGSYYNGNHACEVDLILPPAERVVCLRVYEDGFPLARNEEKQRFLGRNVDPKSREGCWTDYRLTLGPNPRIERVE